MALACSLEKSAFGLKQVRDASTAALRQLLEGLNMGDVEVLLEPRLWSLFHHFSHLGGEEMAALRVKEVHKMELNTKHHGHTALVYIVRPYVAHVHLMVEHMKQEQAARLPATLQCVILHTGVWNALCADIVSRAALSVAIHPFHLGFIPLDNDVLTMGHDTLLQDCYLHGNKTALADLGLALHVLQQSMGDISTVYYKGELSKSVWKTLSQLNGDVPPVTKPKKQRIDCMVLLDRKLDYVAPLSTPLTHEALLENLLGFRDGVVAVDPLIVEASSGNPEAAATNQANKTTWSFNGDDAIFQDIRDKHVQAIGPYLHSLSAVFAEERKQMETMLRAESTTVKQLEEISTNMNTHVDKCAVLAKHVALAEMIQTTTKSKAFRTTWQLEKAILERQDHLGDIEALIWKHTPVDSVLRLLALHSLANGGIPKPVYEHLKTQCLHLYGFEYLHTFENLETMGVLTPAAANGSPFNFVQAWELTGHFDSDMSNPDDPSYVTGGYCPLVVKLVQAAIEEDGWTHLEPLLNRLPGPSAVLTAPVKPKKTKRVLVVVVGGLTNTEMAALRFLGQRLKCTFLMACDGILSGKTLVDQAMESIPNGLMQK
ncbi:Aste57867_15315 [Aphanomyces stellatus]|uniref:Aste57867_15315 protein n=1 Tax=Aphanomyces stellatus TaxID=120398 RepID=A0A485L2V5_9STRA|nr:hypothetical protein As57867_015259 [Aphanomyces stellatus]VFT92124.1 Aste57867_15315 [Aphanomyces stellatus]